MNGLLFFSAYMAFIYMPWDFFFKPIAEDEEVWFGILLTGWSAKLSEPLHWIIYGLACKGFWGMKQWMFPWASLYVLQIAIGMFVWNLLDQNGREWTGSLLVSAPFVVLSIALWKARLKFRNN